MSGHPDSKSADALLQPDDLHIFALGDRLRKIPPSTPASQARTESAFAALEDALSFLHPREPSSAAVHDVRRRFVSPAAFFEAPRHLIEGSGFSSKDALLFSQIPALMRYVARSELGSRIQIQTLSDAAAYLKTRYTGLSIEQFYLLCLDSSGWLIDGKLLQSGTTDSTPFYLKHVLTEVVRTRAHAVVISHNHPNFSPRPSQADIDCTLQLIGALHPIGTVLLDHVIVSGKEALSLRREGFLRANLWLGQDPDDALLRGWLE